MPATKRPAKGRWFITQDRKLAAVRRLWLVPESAGFEPRRRSHDPTVVQTSASPRNIHSHIEHCPLRYLDQLGLWMLELIVQPAENSSIGPGVIVLNEMAIRHICRPVGFFIPTLEKESAFIRINVRLNHVHVVQFRLDFFQWSSGSRFSRLRSNSRILSSLRT